MGSLTSSRFVFCADYHSLDTRRIRNLLEPRSHRLGTRQPLPKTTNDQSSFLSAKANVNGDSFLQDPQPLHTATLDRVTYRGNSRKSGHQAGGKYSQTNGVECRRYHTLGKTSMSQAQRNREISESMNGNVLTSSYSILAEPLNKRSNYYTTLTDSFFYRTNGSTSRRTRDEMDKPKRPKSTERLVDEVDCNECCDFRRDRPRRRTDRSVKSPRNGAAQNYGNEESRRGQSEKKSVETPQEPVYEVIAMKLEPKRESRVERKRDKHNRRPHSAPVLDNDHPVEENKKCGHRNRKPAPPPPAYQDLTNAPLPKYRHPPTTSTTSVLEVENNNKIILKVRRRVEVPETCTSLLNSQWSFCRYN